MIYTTNTIEEFNHQLRKVTKSKSVFSTDDSLMKMLYLAMRDLTKKWISRQQTDMPPLPIYKFSLLIDF